jgi:miniconductance mechanosensitive channel
MTAVLLLVFRDTLLGLVASVQIASNDMVRVGDWIEMPDYGADGDVVDIALHTVKIQNWDKTITTVPTWKLIDGSFKNWRGMSQSGGRRIKRAFHLDINTVRFLRDDELEKYEKYALLRDYIAEKERELVAYNDTQGRDCRINADIRRLTNIGTLRAYIFAYLNSHPKIHHGMTLLVRQLAPTAQGVPIEIYCFTNDIDWGRYEDIQADIFDHIFALLPDFGLRAFQEVSDYRYSPAASGLGPEAPLAKV